MAAFFLRTNVTEWTDEELWKAYIQLTEAEDAFRIQSQICGSSGVASTRRSSTRAHPCLLPIVRLWRNWFSRTCKRAGLGKSHEEFSELAQIRLVVVVLPLISVGTYALGA